MHNIVAYHPGISMHHIPVGGNVPGLLITFGLVFVIGVGIPICFALLVVSGSLGLLASRVKLNWYRNHPLEIQALDLHKLKS